MAETDFSLLDVPRSAPPEDPDAYLRAAIAWHFGEDTGSPFWLRTAAALGFNPLTEVNTFADLCLFPNLVNELRSVPVEDLIPRGYGTDPPVPQIFESGGTTGAPCLGVSTLAGELAGVEQVLAAAQADGQLRPFSTWVMAVSLKGALDALLAQLAADPDLDLDAYLAELIVLFDRATRPDER